MTQAHTPAKRIYIRAEHDEVRVYPRGVTLANGRAGTGYDLVTDATRKHESEKDGAYQMSAQGTAARIRYVLEHGAGSVPRAVY